MSAILFDLQLALRNLAEHRRRSMLIGGAMAFVTSLLILFGALSSGVTDTLMRNATDLATGYVNVNGYYKISASRVGSLIADYAQVEQAVRRAVPELESVIVRGRGFGTLISERSSAKLLLIGVTIDREQRLRSSLQIVSGNIEDLRKPNNILIFESHAKKLDVRVGDDVTIATETLRGLANTQDCRVAAIARDVGLLSQWEIFESMETLATLYQIDSGAAGTLMLYLKPQYLGDARNIAARLRTSLHDAGYAVMPADASLGHIKLQRAGREEWKGQKLDITTWEDDLTGMLWMITAAQMLIALVMAVLLGIITLGIINTLWITVRERTREIGALRSIGMQRGGVMRMFLIETTLLGALASIVGVALGAAATWLLNAANIHTPPSIQLFLMQETLQLALKPAAIVGTIALISVVSGAAGLWPSLRAARLRPIEAMSHVR